MAILQSYPHDWEFVGGAHTASSTSWEDSFHGFIFPTMDSGLHLSSDVHPDNVEATLT